MPFIILSFVLAIIVVIITLMTPHSAWLVVEFEGSPIKVQTTSEGKKFVLDRFNPGDKIGIIVDCGKYRYDPTYHATRDGVYKGIWEGGKLVVSDQLDSEKLKDKYLTF
ncbi:MAG: hypothetical protein LBO09_09580 [Candidatus Peribacteria bacterium]|nr:hypothetical protein [Candidatus Peribacteria bacterium]